MRSYGQYCPITRSCEILGERWTLLIIRDMLVGSRRFNELARGLPGLSRALLSTRLRQMEASGLIRRVDDGYELTQAGQDLRPLVFQMAEWGARYAFGDPRPDELDPEVLVWWIRGRIDTTEVDRRIVLQLDVTDRRRTFWFVVQPHDVSVCQSDPGFEVDAVLAGDIAALYRVWEGEIELLDAARRGDVALQGQRAVVRGLTRWLQLSPVAPYVRAARGVGEPSPSDEDVGLAS